MCTVSTQHVLNTVHCSISELYFLGYRNIYTSVLPGWPPIFLKNGFVSFVGHIQQGAIPAHPQFDLLFLQSPNVLYWMGDMVIVMNSL